MIRDAFARFLVARVLLVTALAAPAAVVAAQDVTPPLVYINPGTSTFGFSADSITVDFCDETNLALVTRTMTLNGANVKTSFAGPGSPGLGCTAEARYTAVLTMARGSNTFSSTVQDGTGNLGSTVVTYNWGVLLRANDMLGQVRASTSQSTTFAVINTSGTPRTFNLSASCAGSASSCSVSPGSLAIGEGGQKTATVTFTSGALSITGFVTLTATDNADGGNTAFATLTAVSGTTWIVPDFSIHNHDHNEVGLCAASCFAMTQAMSTVPYVSLDQPRSVTLLYNSDVVAVRPVLSIDVSLGSGAPSLSEYWLEAKDSTGASITFVNGDTKLRFTAPSPTTTKVRLAGEFDAGALGYTSGVYPITLVATAKHGSGATEALTATTKFMVVNERKSPIAKGWMLAGFSHIRSQGSDAFLTEGDGSGVFFLSCGGGCFVSPPGDYTRLTASGSGSGLRYRRDFPDSSFAYYDNNGFLLNAVTRLQDSTNYTYDGSGRVTQITDPFRTDGGSTHLYWRLVYNGTGLDSIVEPGPNQTQTGGRATDITLAAGDSTLTGWKDPDNVTTTLGYDGSKRLQTIGDRKGAVTTIAYNATTWKLDTIYSPHFLGDKRLYGAGSWKQLKTKFRPWQTVAVPKTTTVTTAFTSVKADTIRGATVEAGGQVAAWTVDRWGAPIVTTQLPGDGLQRVSTAYRQPMGVLADSARTHEGMVEVFEYDRALVRKDSVAGMRGTRTHYTSFAQPDSILGTNQPTQLVTIGSRGRVSSASLAGTSTTTSYGYDSRNRVTSITDALSSVTNLHYESVFGNRDSTKAPGTRTTRTRFDGFGRDTGTQVASLAWRIKRYDTINRVTKQFTAGVTPGDTVFSTYDNLNLTQVTDAAGNVYGFTHDSVGHVSVQTDPASKTDSMFFDDQAQATTWINRRNQSVTTTYDNLHRRLIRGGSQILPDTLKYDPAGLWFVASNNNSHDSTTMDATGFVTSLTTKLATSGSRTFTRVYAKTPVGRFDSVGVTMTGGSPNISFASRRYVWKDLSGVLDTIRLNGQVVDQIGYNAALRRTSDAYAGGQTRSDSLTSTYQNYEIAFSQWQADSLLWRSSFYDAAGRITGFFAVGPNGLQKRAYGYAYDALGRLKTVVDSMRQYASTPDVADDVDFGEKIGLTYTPAFLWKDTVAYDVMGNITAVAPVGGTAGSATYDKNRLTTWPGFNYLWDDAGNITRKAATSGNDTTRYYWSADGLLDSVKVRTRMIHYDYNAMGQLVRKRVDAATLRHFLWDRGHLLAELDGTLANRVAEYAYFPGTDQPLAILTGATSISKTRFLQQDSQGNVIGADSSTTVDGVVIENDPWGGYWYTPGSGVVTSDTNRLRLKGMVFEGDSVDLYYGRARWYDPLTRRYLSQDPIGVAGGINPYVFAANDPVNNSDPSGLIAGDSRGACSLVLDKCGDMGWTEGFSWPAEWNAGDGGRALSPSERAALGQLCTRRPDVCDRVRVYERNQQLGSLDAWILSRVDATGRAVTLGYNIYVPSRGLEPARLAHEVFHSVQFSEWGAIKYAHQAVASQLVYGMGFDVYAIPPLIFPAPFASYSMEQQAMLVQQCFARVVSACSVSAYRPFPFPR